MFVIPPSRDSMPSSAAGHHIEPHWHAASSLLAPHNSRAWIWMLGPEDCTGLELGPDWTKLIAILHKSFVQMDMNAGPCPEDCTSLAGHSLHNPLLQLIYAHEYEYCLLTFGIGCNPTNCRSDRVWFGFALLIAQILTSQYPVLVALLTTFEIVI